MFVLREGETISEHNGEKGDGVLGAILAGLFLLLIAAGLGGFLFVRWQIATQQMAAEAAMARDAAERARADEMAARLQAEQLAQQAQRSTDAAANAAVQEPENPRPSASTPLPE